MVDGVVLKSHARIVGSVPEQRRSQLANGHLRSGSKVVAGSAEQCFYSRKVAYF